MLRNYFHSAWRNLSRNTGYSLINITGLTLGLTAVLLIALFVWDEKQYDVFVPASGSVFRLCTERSAEDGKSNNAVTPPMFATVIGREFPEAEQVARIMQIQSKGLFEKNDKSIYEGNGIMADPAFFAVFPLALKYGSTVKALDDPAAIILSEQLAERYFGTADPTGKEIMVNKHMYHIKAVLKNTDGRFHLPLSYIVTVPYSFMPMDSWRWQQFYTYVKLKPGSTIALLQKKLARYTQQKVDPITKPAGFTYHPFFQPLQKIHLYSADFKFDMAIRGNIAYVNGLTITGIFILLIACFNFINLSTAASLKRAKEVGVRKSAGAGRWQLVAQFISETMLVVILSLFIAISLTLLILPVSNTFTGKAIPLTILLKPVSLLLLTGLGIIITALVGFYPALVLSGYQPAKVLKGNFAASHSNNKTGWLRESLVVLQFALSGLLIISAITVYQQVDYLHHKNLGFNKDQLLFFPMRGDKMRKQYTDFKNELQQVAGVQSVSTGYGFPGDLVAGDEVLVPNGGSFKTFPATQLAVDEDYIRTLGLQLTAGRNFLPNSQPDKDHAFIINETAVKELGFGSPAAAIGQTLLWHVWISGQPDSLKKGQVIGVVKDFHYKSLYDKVTTAVLQLYPPAYSRVAIKIQSDKSISGIHAIQQIWNSYSPGYPIEYKFLDENFEQMYKAEDKLKVLLGLFTAIAVFIGCLGLFGLAAYTAARKTKEIGIRKVLGASINSIVVLLSKDFIRLVIIALLIASPVAWYCMNRWLQDFAYKVTITVWVFAGAGIAAILIALLTISLQAIKAAIANPVKSLRSE